MKEDRIRRLADELYQAQLEVRSVEPLTNRPNPPTLDEAYAIQLALIERRLVERNERIVGKKIGVTSEVVQRALGVDQPDFGQLTSGMCYAEGASLPLREFVQPRIEGELALFLSRNLHGPGVTPDRVLAATASVAACFEIVDSRIRDWKIRIEDTVADNASAGAFVVGAERSDPLGVDWAGCRMCIERNDRVEGEGSGAASLGSPLRAVAWLADTLARYELPLQAGEVILSGSLGPLLNVSVGDRLRVEIEGVGSARVSFH